LLKTYIHGAYKIVEHLIKLGHERIGFIGPTESSDNRMPDKMNRFKGYKEALSDAGIKCHKELLVRGKNRMDRGRSVIKELLKLRNPPTAVFAMHDQAAISAMEGVKELGMKIPDDVAIVGFDDIELASYTDPPLTTIRVSMEELGKRAVKRLMELMGNKHQQSQMIILPVELVVRESCGMMLHRKSRSGN